MDLLATFLSAISSQNIAQVCFAGFRSHGGYVREQWTESSKKVNSQAEKKGYGCECGLHRERQYLLDIKENWKKMNNRMIDYDGGRRIKRNGGI